MARQNINLGTAPGGLDGDDARTAFTKTNANFTELYGGTVLQPLNAKLSAISASVWAANQLMYTTGTGTVAMTALTAFARTLLDDADAAAARTTLGAVGIGQFGVGANVSPLLADFNDPTTPNGTYRVTTATAGTHPGTQFGTVTVEHYDNAYVKQTFSGNGNTGLAGITYTRFYNNGGWTAWIPFLNRGDYGVGSYAVRVTPAQIEALTPESGFYEVQPSTTAQWPLTPFPNAWTRMLHIRHNNGSGYWSQVALDFNLRPRMKLRGMSNGTIGEWTEVYSQISILGTVGQAAGVPTGAIIERGFNANGQYTKFADGAMIQWGVYMHASDIPVTTLNTGGGYRSAQVQVPFPTAFIQRTSSDEQPIAFSCYANNTASGVRAYPADDSSTVVGQFVLQTPGSAYTAPAATTRIRWMAIGRWY